MRRTDPVRSSGTAVLWPVDTVRMPGGNPEKVVSWVGRIAVRVGVGLAAVAGLMLTAATPAFAQAGYRAQVTELPDEAVAGAGTVEMTVVVSRNLGGECEKVRWSLVLRSDGVGLDEIRAARVEQGTAFAVDVQTDGDDARLTDVQLDPGILCADRTVTAQYQFSFADDAEGKVTFTVEAYDENTQLLADTAATLPVVGEPGGPDPEPSEPAEEPVDSQPGAEVPDGDAPAGVGGGGPQPVDAIPAGDASGIPVAWFIAGGAMVFVGFGLLLRVRARLMRGLADPDDAVPAVAGAGVGAKAPPFGGWSPSSRAGRRGRFGLGRQTDPGGRRRPGFGAGRRGQIRS
ncbi:hypothetical protein ACFHWS_14975 [Micromonospora sp. LOL_013]|uniref:hypothetical protein n=1 Tax=Micromonospora sp. LOL_013 TaxID=3345414 RepID=UPI003A8C2E94